MLNFRKESIFSRRAAEEKITGPMVTEGLLAVWGSPGAGKTTVAVKLAKHIADQKKNVVLVLCDMVAPMLPCILHASELECERSLGTILGSTHVTETILKSNLMTLKKNRFLTVLGMVKGENEYTYPPYTETQAKELLGELRRLAPFVVVDCGSHIAADILSAVTLIEADSVLRLASCELKSVSYFSSQLQLLMDHRWEADRQYKIASNVKAHEAGDQLAAALGNTVFQLPHSEELESQYLAGNLLEDLVLKDSREFRKELARISKEVFGI
ncbi:MAG: ParA family protein [Clostridia bacterium]|nr:ParA family protein [Clostridia bacterium]